ncbi:mitochondrial DEDDh 3'-5' exonuclease domain family protein [Andalucia godoyi]|uniref:Mitochondrial DEDDh 3'-5' exonuclease domain family protein n=1 Tax=Andalucia godoyi TaxID=505711 RepID=A0A8K0AJ99_ANDGO|nr:mitochondrial DEDDh 3'-5' exonuclease domain family protein [Andalucia godoyi]|eukprot:ANDGO_02275.mRNA.1 mitochondrial DEDDh 3'-5' exonuclease domain family protein
MKCSTAAHWVRQVRTVPISRFWSSSLASYWPPTADLPDPFYSCVPDDVVVVDVEASGYWRAGNPRKDRVIEVGAVRLRGPVVVDTFQSLVQYSGLLSTDIINLTRITPDMLRTAPDVKSVLSSLERFIGTDTLVAHNASFDVSFLQWEFLHERIAAPRALQPSVPSSMPEHLPKVLCSLKIARRVFKETQSHSIESLIGYLKLLPPQQGLHRALGDAMSTSEIWNIMMKSIQTMTRNHRYPSLQLLDALQTGKIAEFESICRTWQFKELDC